MTDSLNYDGLSLKDNATLVSDLQSFFQQNYAPNGEQIDFSPASPDGQLINLLATIGTTHRELLTQVYNATDPTKCEGTQQDSKYQLNYLFRKGGSYTTQNIDVVATKTVNLQGLDGSYNDSTSSAFTVSDDSGNVWYLIDSSTVYAGTNTLIFRAKDIGAVTPTIGTITNIVTVTDGIKSVINNVGFTSLGVEQESNLDFMLRRERSTQIANNNTFDTIVANILDLEGVTDCSGEENRTNETSENGTPPHYLWLIVDGGSNEEIADIIYSNIAGSGTRGKVEINKLNIAGQQVPIYFDRPTIEPFYIKFDLKLLVDIGEINQGQIKDYIGNNLIYKLGEDLETSKVTQECTNGIESAGGNAFALNVEVSAGGVAEASIGSSTGITGATVNSTTFQDVIGDVTGSYVFTYNADGWTFNENIVELSDYGIEYTGTAEKNDTITINFTQGTWVDFIACPSLDTIFATDPNKIYINVLE
jgi:hypothetical protein